MTKYFKIEYYSSGKWVSLSYCDFISASSEEDAVRKLRRKMNNKCEDYELFKITEIDNLAYSKGIEEKEKEEEHERLNKIFRGELP